MTQVQCYSMILHFQITSKMCCERLLLSNKVVKIDRFGMQCKDILLAAHRISERAGYCHETGLHMSIAPVLPTIDSPVAQHGVSLCLKLFILVIQMIISQVLNLSQYVTVNDNLLL